jgi:hypothetical protein
MLGSMQHCFKIVNGTRLKQGRNENEKYSCTAIKLKGTTGHFQQVA